jgi:putative tributyrin esterase
MAYLTINFESEYLNNNHEVSIILPDKPRGITAEDFYGSGKKYKVLWLLHGTYGDHTDWIRKSNIELYACEKDLIVVMPSGMNANYANWEKFSIGYNMYDYLFEELMPMIYNWFPASDKREDNFIAGLSMGGRGTAYFAFSKPQYFAGAAVLSAAPVKYDDDALEGKGMMGSRTAICVENAGGKEAFLASPENVWDIAAKAVKDGVDLPKLYFACGGDDKGIVTNLGIWKEYADGLGIEATYEIIPGYRHEWRFWDIAIEKAMDLFGIVNESAGNPF